MSTSSDSGRPIFTTTRQSRNRGALWTLPQYVAWRIVTALVIVILFLTLVFVAVEVVPMDPTRVLLPRGGCNPLDNSCALRYATVRHWGLDRPVLDRYVIFLTNVLTGNLGPSLTYRNGEPIWGLIAPTLLPTLVFAGVLTILLALLALPIGGWMRRKNGGVLDRVVSLLMALAFSVPAVMLTMLALYLFAFVIPIYPLAAFPSPDPLVQFGNELGAATLPGLVFLGSMLGLCTWIVRDHPLSPESEVSQLPPGEWRQEKRTLRARIWGGLPRFLAALPIVFPWSFGAVLLVGVTAAFGGLGNLLWYGTLYQDFFLVVGVIVVSGLLVVFPVMIGADILHYGLTRSWERGDEAHVDRFRIDVGDLFRWLWRTLTSVFGLAGIALIAGVVILSLAAPLLVGAYPNYTSVSRPDLPPSPDHLLGTDAAGRDLYALLVYGGQTLLVPALLGFALALVAGLAVALAMGFFGERASVFLALPVDLFLLLSLPFAFLLISIYGQDSPFWGPALVAWPITTRLLMLDLSGMVAPRGGSTQAKLAWRKRGTRALRLGWGAAPLLVASALLATSFTVLVWATLGFVGLGPIGPGVAEGWGQIVNDAFNHLAFLKGEWWWFVPPILCTFLAALGPTLLSLRMRQIFKEPPKVAALVVAPGPTAPAVPPGSIP